MVTALVRALGIAVCLTAGCALPPPAAIVHQPMTIRPQAPTEPATATGAIYQAQRTYRPLFEDVRARNVGDTLIVQINEKTAANKKASSQFNRASDATATVGPMSVIPFASFSGLTGSGSSSNTFEGAAGGAATISRVVRRDRDRGARQRQPGRERGETDRMTQERNTSGSPAWHRARYRRQIVSSTQVADARIEYKANGYIDEAQVLGARALLPTFLPYLRASMGRPVENVGSDIASRAGDSPRRCLRLAGGGVAAHAERPADLVSSRASAPTSRGYGIVVGPTTAATRRPRRRSRSRA
jgi:flagellar L-ring protein precursor FlgH